jgi:formylmethanofuran dehydrogenase subunit E
MKVFWIGLLVLFSFVNVGRAEIINPWDLGIEEVLQKVQLFHRPDAGPWVVAGFRIGSRALRTLQLKPYGFNFRVTHYSPAQVQYTCIADGLQAATGASIGKLNLTLVTAEAKELRTVVTTRDGGTLTFTLTPEFIKKFLNVPYELLPQKAREAAALNDQEIFRFEGVR